MPYYTKFEVPDEAVERAQGANPFEVMWDDTLGCGLQMAIFDAVGKLTETPVWALIGQRVRDLCQIGWWAIDMPAEDWILECKEAEANGYTTFKTKARPWFDLEDQVERLCEAVPDYFKIDMDFNDFALDPVVAKPLCARLERFDQIAIWESPIRQEDVEGNRLLRQQLRVPIAQHVSRPKFATQLTMGMCDGFVLEAGVSTATRDAHICDEFNRPFWLQWVGTHLTANYCLHLQAVMKQALWPAIHCHHMYERQFVNEPFVVTNGMAAVPDGPGIGVNVDWDVVEEFRIEPKERPYPHPDLLIKLQWPSGRTSYFAHAQQMWEAFQRGDQPAFVRGVHLERVHDDGTDEWRQLYQRALEQPVYL